MTHCGPLGNGDGEESEQALQLICFGKRRAKQSRQSIERIAPARLVSLHLDAHAQRIESSELEQAQRQELSKDRRAVEFAMPVATAHEVGLVLPPVNERSLFLILGNRSVLAHAAAIFIHNNDVLPITGQDNGRTIEERDLPPKQKLIFLVRIDGEIGINQVEIVGPVVNPVAFAEPGLESWLRPG